MRLLLLSLVVLFACGKDEPQTQSRSYEPQTRIEPHDDAETESKTEAEPETEPETTPEPQPEPEPQIDPDALINVGWVGGNCEGDGDCTIDGATCKVEEEGFPGGMCSTPCSSGGFFCPDTDAPNTTATFCTKAGSDQTPTCVSKCAFLSYEDQGCRDGYTCSTEFRPDGTGPQDVCVPTSDGPNPVSECRKVYARAGNTYVAAVNNKTVCNGCSANQVCDVADAIKIYSAINNVKFFYNGDTSKAGPFTMRCELAAAMMRVADIAKQMHVTEIHHLGTYNCRFIAGTTTLSQHSFGRAIDFSAFKLDTGEVFSVLDDWEDGDDTPETAGGQFLYEFVHRVFEDGVFNVCLTPEYNTAHNNHFHCDLTPGSSYIKDGNRFLGRFSDFGLSGAE